MARENKKKTKKSVRHWVITELGGGHSARIHMHGFIWDNEGIALNEWKNGYTYEGEYMSNKAITYTTKYMLKIPEKNPEFIGKVMCSKGIGKGYWKSRNAKRNIYVRNNTNENYKMPNGAELPLPQYYRNYIYTSEEKETLWIEKQERGYRYIGGEKVFLEDEEEWENLFFPSIS